MSEEPQTTIDYVILERKRKGFAHSLISTISLGFIGIEIQVVQTKEVAIVHGGVPPHDVKIPFEGRESTHFTRTRPVLHLWGLTKPKI